LGAPGGANTVWTLDRAGAAGAAAAATTGATTTTVARADLYAADEADRNDITGVFEAIGVVVAGVATVGAVTTVGVGCYERRRELAVVRALGASRGGIRRVLVAEVAPLAALGWLLGLAGGSLAAQGIMGFFEASSGVALGYTFAAAAVPVGAIAVALFVVVVGAAGARGLDRRAPASILRAAA
jgi:putative ABC transport system permease protein